MGAGIGERALVPKGDIARQASKSSHCGIGWRSEPGNPATLPDWEQGRCAKMDERRQIAPAGMF
jgi:hypothetical protein